MPSCVSKQKRRVAVNQQYDGAVSWCKFYSKSPRAAIRTGRWPLVKRSSLQTRLKGQKKPEDKRALLTNDEEEEFADWLKLCGDANQGKKIKEQAQKILEILDLRQRANRASRGRKTIPLSTAAKNALRNKSITKHFFHGFYKRNPQLSEKYQREEDKTRHDAMNEGTIQQHFFGKFGLGRTHGLWHYATRRHNFGRGQGTCAQ
jgi:hypothetical protein